jgi:N-acetylneuraminic acid mutarotase
MPLHARPPGSFTIRLSHIFGAGWRYWGLNNCFTSRIRWGDMWAVDGPHSQNMNSRIFLSSLTAGVCVLGGLHAENVAGVPLVSEIFDRVPVPRVEVVIGPAVERNESRGIDAPAQPPVADGPLAGAWEKRSSFLRGRIYHSAVWTYSEMIVWGGGSEHQFYNDGGIYDPAKDAWKPVSETNAPSGRWGHAAVWTGREMLVWGGRSSFAPSDHKNDGGLYDPATDTWRPMSTVGAPEARSQMAAVWTGEELLVWGGWADGGKCPASGGRYNPRTDTWKPLTMENAPVGRMEVTGVWTGREFLVWGGLLEGGKISAGTGGRYDPERNTWQALPAEGAPLPTRGMQAVWTGEEMVVWSGSHLTGETQVNVGLKAGARFSPTTNTWKPTTENGAPDGRLYYGAAWTGTEMVVWSGGDQEKGNISTGGRYNPATDSWQATAMNRAPSGRGISTAVWTGEGVLFFGGSTGGVEAYNETFFYRPKGAVSEGN